MIIESSKKFANSNLAALLDKVFAIPPFIAQLVLRIGCLGGAVYLWLSLYGGSIGTFILLLSWTLFLCLFRRLLEGS